MSSAGSAGRRGGTSYAAYHEPKGPTRPSTVVDAMLVVSGFVMFAALVYLVMHIA